MIGISAILAIIDIGIFEAFVASYDLGVFVASMGFIVALADIRFSHVTGDLHISAVIAISAVVASESGERELHVFIIFQVVARGIFRKEDVEIFLDRMRDYILIVECFEIFEG